MFNSLLPALLGISLEASRVTTDLIFPQVHNDTSSTLYLAFFNGGSLLAAMLLATNNTSTFSIDKIAPVSFFILCSSYATLSFVSHSTFLFLALVTCIGLATSAASVSSSSMLQISTSNRNRSNAIYRLSGVISKLLIPVAIATISTQTSLIFISVALLLLCTTCVLQWNTSLATLAATTTPLAATGATEAIAASTATTTTPTTTTATTTTTTTTTPTTTITTTLISRSKWLQVLLYCLIVSLPNVAGGLVRALLHTRIASVSMAHSYAQFASIATIFITSVILESFQASNGAAWITVTIQASLMSVAAFAIIVADKTTDITIAFVVFRCIEESAKLPNATILHQLSSGSNSLSRFVASQKVIGAFLKIICSIVSTYIIRNHGTIFGLVMANILCAVGAAGLMFMYISSVLHVQNDSNNNKKEN